MPNVYEIVSGQILLDRRERFFELHEGVLLPMMSEMGIHPVVMLVTEIGRYGRFLDVYRYRDFGHYEELTDRLLGDPRMKDYYGEIALCVRGSISVELARELPYAKHWTR